MNTLRDTFWRMLLGGARTGDDTAYSAAEIRGYMAAPPTTNRARQASQAVGRVLGHLDDDVRAQFRGSDRMFRKLTFIVINYGQGKTVEEIAEALEPFVYAEEIEQALDFVAAQAAYRLNNRIL